MYHPTGQPGVQSGIVYGPAGCRKTRSIKKDAPRGVFYYQVNSSIDFAQGLPDTIGLNRSLGV